MALSQILHQIRRPELPAQSLVILRRMPCPWTGRSYMMPARWRLALLHRHMMDLFIESSALLVTWG